MTTYLISHETYRGCFTVAFARSFVWESHYTHHKFTSLSKQKIATYQRDSVRQRAPRTDTEGNDGHIVGKSNETPAVLSGVDGEAERSRRVSLEGVFHGKACASDNAY